MEAASRLKQLSIGRLGSRSHGRMGSLVATCLFLGLLITALNIWQLSTLQNQHFVLEHAVPEGRPSTESGQTFVVFANHPDSGYLQHVYNVLQRAGYRRANYNISSDWDLMWAHNYPFKKIKEKMLALKPGQKVNKFPGSGYITNKVNLATSGLKNVPPAFHMPDEKEQLLEYSRKNPDRLFVQKSNNHRGIQIQGIQDLDLAQDGSFVQEFVHNPLLVDGYKFDIGIYTTLTSVDPLRIYVHHSDALLRFCPVQYHPFDAANRDKYVVGDDYLPSWKIPSFSKYMNTLGFSFTDTLNTYIRSLGRDPEAMWEEIYSTIADVYKSSESLFVKALSHYPHKDAFFEMVRFDFVIDEDLKVYLMEANMSPNLSSAHFPPNRLLYEQVIHSMLRLVGVIQGSVRWDVLHPQTVEESDMQVAEKDILVFPEQCASDKCSQGGGSCGEEDCELCRHCLTLPEIGMLKQAWLEHVNRHATRRIFPRPVSCNDSLLSRSSSGGSGLSRIRSGGSDLSRANRKMENWYRGKCQLDVNWCN